MKKSSFISALAIGVLSIGLASAAPADAVNQVRQNAAQVLTILKSGDETSARRKAEAYVLPYFDFRSMTESVVGSAWSTASDAQKQALTKEFQTLLIRVYSGTMSKFKNATVNIKDNPTVRKNNVIVRAEVSTSGQKPVVIDFTTYQSGSKYLVKDVVVSGGSLITVYRGQFNNEIKAKGIDGLIAYLKAKNSK